MPFRFPLQPVLRLRKSLERREELRLNIIRQELARLRLQMEELKDSEASAANALSRTLAQGARAAELHFYLACAAERARHREQLADRIAEIEKLREAQQLAFYRARQEREVVETVHGRSLAAYQRQQIRREQQQLDDLFLQRMTKTTAE